MKLIKYDFDNEIYHLCFNGAAMFEINELLGEKQIVDVLADNTPQGYNLTCHILAILSEQGEAVKKHLGHEHQKPLTLEEVISVASPADVLTMRSTIIKAVAIGYGREINDDEETDTGLIELQKKTDKTK